MDYTLQHFFWIGGIALAMIKGKSPIGMIAVVGMMIGCVVGLLCLIHIDKQKYAVQIEQARKQDEEAESQKKSVKSFLITLRYLSSVHCLEMHQRLSMLSSIFVHDRFWDFLQ